MSNKNFKKIELLAPAGDIEKLITAVDYGADAVYFGGEDFSLRASAGNFSIEEMRKGVDHTHERGRKCYLTVNAFSHNEDIKPIENYFSEIKKSDIDMDAFIVSDPGVIEILKKIIPDAVIHLSTQANTTNYNAAGFWHRAGIKRAVVARELALKEIKEIRENIPADMELEAFVHGAMCISYSGRCLLSNFMAGRDANRGMCAHPCRWKYSLTEEERPGEYYPVEEDKRGTYIMNSKDLCMIEHIPELIDSGLDSIKIEGRMKSIFYTAVVTSVYRKAIDAYYKDPENYRYDPAWMTELEKVSHREFTTGFYFSKPGSSDQNYKTSSYIREYSFTGLVKEYDAETKMALVEQRNKMCRGEEIEIFGPETDFFKQKLEVLLDEWGDSLDSAPHPQQLIKIKTEQPVSAGFIIRKRKEQ